MSTDMVHHANGVFIHPAIGPKAKPLPVGETFCRLTLLHEIEPKLRKGGVNRYALFECSCGKKHASKWDHVKSGKTKSCGCLSSETSRCESGYSSDGTSFIGTRFNLLTVICETSDGNSHVRFVDCRCECGSVANYRLGDVRSGHTKSCGCAARPNVARNSLGKKRYRAAGSTDHPMYRRYYSILSRTTTPDSHNWPRYGGRGITLFPDWQGENGFENFAKYAETLPGYPSGEIDRLDNDRGYEPGNIQLRSRQEQMQNTSVSRWWFVLGEKYESARSAADAHGVDASTIISWCGRVKGRRPRAGCWSEIKYAQPNK